jgi:hypothetical protein
VEIVSFKNEIFSDFNGFTKLVQSTLKAETANFDNKEVEQFGLKLKAAIV